MSTDVKGTNEWLISIGCSVLPFSGFVFKSTTYTLLGFSNDNYVNWVPVSDKYVNFNEIS